MTLQQLKNVLAQLEMQYAQLASAPPKDNPGLAHLNAIELTANQKLMQQLITLEEQELAAPPGKMGPTLE